MAERTTIIDFLEKYTRLYSDHVYLKEKPGEEWIEITYEQTSEEAWRIGAGLMALGVEKGEKVALLSEGRAMWVLAEFGAMYAGLTDVPLSINLREGHDLTYRINHSEATWILVSAYQLPKIRKVRSLIDKMRPECVLETDGGIDERTARLVADAGCTVAVAGSSVFRASDRTAAIRALRADDVNREV